LEEIFLKFFYFFSFFFVFSLTLIFAPRSWAQEEEWYQNKPIRDIVFTGLRHVSASDLEGIVAEYKNKLYTDELFYALQSKLILTEYFEYVIPNFIPYNSENTELRIELSVVERPIISSIRFAGNSKVKRGDLNTAISLKVNDVANQVKIKAAETAIFNAYVEKGFPNVRVRSEQTTEKDGTIGVIFQIIEGERISISAIIFEGNEKFPSKTLQGQLVSKTKGVFNDGAFSEAKLTEDRNSVVKYYRDRGYMDARIVDVVRKEDRDDKGNVSLTLTFKIFEGEIYRFGGVTFEGNKIFSTEELSKLVRSKQGEIINGTRLTADLQRVSDKYYENGYIFNNIDMQEKRENGFLSFNIVIAEHGRAHIESIRIQGNEKTKESVILREIPLETGGVFSRTKVVEAVQNLYSLQFFSNVAPDMEQGSDENLMNLIFTVEEQPTMDVQFGLTFSGTADPGTFPISALLKWNDRNFLGLGNALGAELNLSTNTQSLSLNYTQNYIFNLPLSVGFDLTMSHASRQSAIDSQAPYFNGNEDYAYPDGFDSYAEYASAGKVPPDEFLMDYDQWRISLGASTGYRWPILLGNFVLGRLGVGGGVRIGFLMNQYDADIYRPFDPTIRERNNQWTPSNSVWTSVSLDKRDIYYDPTKGYYLSERFGYYGLLPIEPEHYTKSDTKFEFFFTPVDIPVSDKWSFRMTFGFHSGLSFIFPDFTHPKPIIENGNKLAIDGMFNARGWNSEYSHKGLAMWENWAELRIPLIPRVLAWDFFFDAAVIQSDWDEFWRGDGLREKMRFSTGGGLRFALPQFPLRLLFAKRFRVIDGEVQWYPKEFFDVVLSFTLFSY
jgi:outer membrane protein insertion porin family